MMPASKMRRVIGLIAIVASLTVGAWPANAQQQPPKQEDVPFWAIGRPSTGPGAAMAPVPAFPIPTPADKLPIAK